MLGAGRLLLSCAICRSREILASSLCSRCGSITNLSYLKHLQARVACYATHFLRSSLPSQTVRPLSLTTANRKPKKLVENDDRSSLTPEELVDAYTEDSAGSGLRLKRQKHPRAQEVQQLRFGRHIESLVKKGRVGEAHEVFQQMKQAKVQPNVFVFNLLIAGYGREGDVRTCFKLFNEIKKRSLLPTDHTYSGMFSACAKAGPKATEILRKLQEEIERRNVHLDTISTNALLAALAACGFHDDTWDIYESMIKRGVNPDPQTFTSLLVASTHDKVGGFEAAQRAWSEMCVHPDLHCFNVLLQCIRDCGMNPSFLERVDEDKRTVALKLDLVNFDDSDSSFCQDEAAIVKLDVSGVTSFALGDGSSLRVYIGQVTGKERGGLRGPAIRWLENEDVEKLLSLLKKLQLPPEVRTFNLLAQLTFDASFLMREMAKLKRRIVKPDSRFMVTAIKQQALLGNLPGAKLLLQYAKKANLDLAQAGYQAVARCCLKEKEGIELLQEMRADNVLPNDYVIGTLLGNAAGTRNYEYLTALLKKMMHLEVVPNDTMLKKLEAAARHTPRDVWQARRLNGFKGFYKIWKGVMVPQDEREENLTSHSQNHEKFE